MEKLFTGMLQDVFSAGVGWEGSSCFCFWALEVLRASLDGAWRNLGSWKVSLHVAGGGSGWSSRFLPTIPWFCDPWSRSSREGAVCPHLHRTMDEGWREPLEIPVSSSSQSSRGFSALGPLGMELYSFSGQPVPLFLAISTGIPGFQLVLSRAWLCPLSSPRLVPVPVEKVAPRRAGHGAGGRG